jgi:flavine halogenase
LTVIVAFIDPFFSSGIHLAFTGGLAAAASIAASVRGDCGETNAADWHSQRVAVSYTRYVTN